MPGARELLSPDRPDRVGCSGAEKIEAELLQFGAIDFGELHFQQNLAFVERATCSELTTWVE